MLCPNCNYIFPETKLTHREMEILFLVKKALKNGEISDILNISVKTVKNHMVMIYKKTGIKSRLELGLKMEVPEKFTLQIPMHIRSKYSKLQETYAD